MNPIEARIATLEHAAGLPHVARVFECETCDYTIAEITLGLEDPGFCPRCDTATLVCVGRRVWPSRSKGPS